MGGGSFINTNLGSQDVVLAQIDSVSRYLPTWTSGTCEPLITYAGIWPWLVNRDDKYPEIGKMDYAEKALASAIKLVHFEFIHCQPSTHSGSLEIALRSILSGNERTLPVEQDSYS